MRSKFNKALAVIICVVTLFSWGALAANAAEPAINFPSGASSVSITLDGRKVLDGRAAIIDSVTYVALRDFCDLMGNCEISWNERTKTATVKKDSTTIVATTGDLYIYANERCLYTVTPIRIIDNKMFLPIRPIAKAFGVNVGWDNASRSVTLESTGQALLHGSKFYNEDDVYWLSRIISAESKGEPLKGQIAVGNVVLNRVRSKSYPNTIYGVIFDKKGGTQFSPVSFGTIYQKPSASAIIAAKICLEGYTVSDKILFFMNPRIATSNWISKNRPFEFRIGNHDFYS